MSVVLRLIVFLFGKRTQQEVGLQIGHAELEVEARRCSIGSRNLALLMFIAMFFVIFCGYPVAFVMGGRR